MRVRQNVTQANAVAAPRRCTQRELSEHQRRKTPQGSGLKDPGAGAAGPCPLRGSPSVQAPTRRAHARSRCALLHAATAFSVVAVSAIAVFSVTSLTAGEA